MKKTGFAKPKAQYVMVNTWREGWLRGRLISIDKKKGLLLGGVHPSGGNTVARRRFKWSDLRDDPPFWYLSEGRVPK